MSLWTRLASNGIFEFAIVVVARMSRVPGVARKGFANAYFRNKMQKKNGLKFQNQEEARKKEVREKGFVTE